MRSTFYFRNQMNWVLPFSLFWVVISTTTAFGQVLTIEEKKDIALEVTRLFRASRAVISQNQ